MDDQRLNLAIAAIRNGDLNSGRRLLMSLLDDEPRNETAWIWLSATFSDSKKQEQCLETVLEINPQNEAAQIGIARLHGESHQLNDNISNYQKATTPVTNANIHINKSYSSPLSKSQNGKNNVLRNVGILSVVMICLCICAGISFVAKSFSDNDVTQINVSANNGLDDEALREIPPTYTPEVNRNLNELQFDNDQDFSYGEIPINFDELHSVATAIMPMDVNQVRDVPGMPFQYSLCSTGCETKLIMRAEEYDDDNLHEINLFINYDDEDEFIDGNAIALAILSISTGWEDPNDWFFESLGEREQSGDDEFSTLFNGISIEMGYDYSNVDNTDYIWLYIIDKVR